MKVGTEKWPKVSRGKQFSLSPYETLNPLIPSHMSVASFAAYRRWHLTLALISSSSSTLITLITSGVTSSLWQPWASQISLFLGCQTFSCWWLAWWVVLLPEPLPSNPLTVRLSRPFQEPLANEGVWVCETLLGSQLQPFLILYIWSTNLAKWEICCIYLICFFYRNAVSGRFRIIFSRVLFRP